MPHSQGSPMTPNLSRNNSIPHIDTFSFITHSHVLQFGVNLPKGLFPVDLPVKILKELLPSSILAIRLAHLNLLD